MNIVNFGFSGGDAAPRPGTGTVPASSGSMFGNALPFRLQLASSTAKLSAVDGMAATVDGAKPAFAALGGFELSDLPERISFGGAEDGSAEQANYDTFESSELAPTLALLAPIVDAAPTGTAVAAGAKEASARTAPAIIPSATPTGSTADTGNGDLEAPAPANTGTAEEVLADPDGDVAAMLRRVRATANGTGSDRVAAQQTATDGDRMATPRLAETVAAETARVRTTATSSATPATGTQALSGGDLRMPTTESAERAPDARMAALSISDLRVGGTMRQGGEATTARIRGAGAAERSMARSETTEAGYEIDMTAAESSTVDDAPLPRQVTAPATEMRTGQAAPFAANLAAASSADQPNVETGKRSETAQTLPLDQRFGERLGAMVGAAMGNATLKDGMLRLQVTPEHLGPIEIEMDTSGASERLQITVENEAVRQAVAQAHARIEQELRQAGAKLAGIDVALRDTGADAQGNGQTNSRADTDGRRPGSTTPHESGLPDSDGTDPVDDRSAPRTGQTGNILYA